MSINPLPTLVRRFPRAFGMEWVEDEMPFATNRPHTYDLRPVRYLSGPVYDNPSPAVMTPAETQENPS